MKTIFDFTVGNFKALIINSDIKALRNKMRLTPDELSIINHDGVLESDIQQRACAATKRLMLYVPKNKNLKFIQIDNGDSAIGKLTSLQRMALIRRKKAEGTCRHFPDAMILASCNGELRVWFVEFKRVGTKSQIEGDKEHFQAQLEMIDELREMGASAYITNNLVFFEKVILKEVKDFLKI